MGVLIEAFLAKGAKVVEGTFFIKMRNVDEFVWSCLEVALSVQQLLLVRLHWWNGSSS